MNRRLRLVLIIVDIALILVVARLLYFIHVSRPVAGPSQTVEIVADMDARGVAYVLFAQKIIPSAEWYRAYGWFSGLARRPRAGTYELQPGESFTNIARTLALGPERKEARLRVIEGWNLRDITALLVGAGASSTEIVASIGGAVNSSPFDSAWREEFPFLRKLPASHSLEGYLYPDTYRVWETQLPEGLIRKQLQEFSDYFATATVSAKSAPLKTFDEVVTLASILEREVRSYEDRRHVAGIFLNRLRIGMPLQTDATLSYLTASKRDRANASDLALDSRYNSYRYRGLPPGPIANPSAPSIKAVLDPLTTSDLYFLTDKAGTVYYAKTLDEHVRNKRKAGLR